MNPSRTTSTIQRLKGNVFVNQDEIAKIEKSLAEHKISEEAAYQKLKALESMGPASLSTHNFEDEWEALAKLIVESETQIKKNARFQYLLALVELPFFVVVVLIAAGSGFFAAAVSTTTAALLIGAVAAIAAHTFFIIRVQQQATLVAERLAEKRLGILFLRIAASAENKHIDTEKLISAGTAMFLGHQAPNTVALTSEDFSAFKK